MEAILTTLYFKLLPFYLAFAATEPTENTTVSKIVGWAASIGGGIVAIALIISIVKEGWAYSKGQGNGSVLGIIGKVLFLILMIGIIFLAANYFILGKTAKNIGEQGVNIVATEVNTATGGGGTAGQ